MIGMCWTETLKLIGRRRWLAIFPASVLAALLNLSTLHCQTEHRSVLNVWDSVFGTLGDWISFRFIFMLLFIFLVADCVLEDVASNWAWLTLSRSPSRHAWWTAKVVSLFIAGLVYFSLGAIIILLFSLTQFPYAADLSPYATGLSNYGQGLGTMAFPNGTNPWLLCVQFVLYSTFACGVFALIPVTISLVIRKDYVAPLIPFVWLFLSHLGQTNRLLARIDLILRMFYASYFHSRLTAPISLSGSLFYLSSVGIGLYLVGVYVVQRADF